MKFFDPLTHVGRTALEVIFPPSDDEVLFRAEQHQLRELAHRKRGRLAYYCLPYHTPVVRATIHLNKFHYHVAAQRALATAIEPVMTEHFANFLVLPIRSHVDATANAATASNSCLTTPTTTDDRHQDLGSKEVHRTPKRPFTRRATDQPHRRFCCYLPRQDRWAKRVTSRRLDDRRDVECGASELAPTPATIACLTFAH